MGCEIAKENSINLLLPVNYGDALIVCGFKDAIEKYHNLKVHLVIKPEHEGIMKLYGITEYTVKDFGDSYIHKNIEAFKAQKFEAGADFIAFPSYEAGRDFYNNKIDFLELFRRTFNLPSEAEFKKPQNKPELTEELKNKIEKIAPLEKVIIFSPEAIDTDQVSHKAFEDEIKILKSRGYTIISSVKDKKEAIKGTVYIPLTIYEALAIAVNCAGVYSVRSGFVDLVIQYTDNITIYYPDKRTYDLFNFRYLYSKDRNINEIIINGSFIQKIGPILQEEYKSGENIFRFCITLFRVKKRRYMRKYCILGIPVWKTLYSSDCRKDYLFGFICIFKKQNKHS